MAEARPTTYADEHASSWQVRFGRPSHEMTTRQLVERLNEAYASEVPVKLHEGPDHIGPGGVPEMTPRFVGYLSTGTGAITAPDDLEPVYEGIYRKPLQRTIAGMKNSTGKVAWWGAIVERIILGGEVPVNAAMAEGSHRFEAVRSANEALAECHRRLTPTKLALPQRERVA
jgi:hypothetical protein